jgi:ribosome-associated heat shock protein Hsp15
MADVKEKLRIDKYLWSIRLFKTRSQAADACDNGKVKFLGNNIKASRTVNVGDVYDVKTEARRWMIKITGLLYTRVPYPEAIKNYEDVTPPEELDKVHFEASSFNTGKRLSKVGRPTKKQLRDIRGFMGESAEE